MPDEPTPPPEEDEDSEDGDEVYPFWDGGAGGGPETEVRAGWARSEDGEPVELVVNYQGSAGSPAALSALETALEWYRDTVAALARSQQGGE